MGQLDVYKARTNARLSAMRNNATAGKVVATVLIAATAAGIGAAESKTGNANIAPLAAVAGGTAALFTDGMAREGAIALFQTGVAISSYNATRSYYGS